MLEVHELKKEYKNFALKEISFNVKRGEIVGIIGPNGSGKSTTMKSIMGIIPRDGGEIIIEGERIAYEDYKYREKVGYVGEELDFYEKIPLKKIYRFVSKCYSNWDDVVFHDLIKRFELSLDKKICECSKGMKLKFSLALALSINPKILILDEPTSGLDPLIRIELLDILNSSAKEKDVAVLFSSHITEDLDKIADKFIFIYNGRILKELTRKEYISEATPLDILLEKYIKEFGGNYVESDPERYSV
jgi:ABC-2 type transport system ATP-binding protein